MITIVYYASPKFLHEEDQRATEYKVPEPGCKKRQKNQKRGASNHGQSCSVRPCVCLNSLCAALPFEWLVSRSWTLDLTWKLINGIADNEEIKNGLYPLSGGNTSLSKGESKTKANYHWALALSIFEDHPEYGTVIEDAKDVTGERRAWGLKVKNRIQR